MRRLAIGTLGFAAALAGQAQSIDTGLARATVGQALHLVLRVRAFETGPAGLGRDCVRAEVSQGADTAPHQPLAWTRAARAVDGTTWVTLSDPQPVREPTLHVRVALVCGAPYTREFTLLADAPDPTASASAAGAQAHGAPLSRRAPRVAMQRPSEGPKAHPTDTPPAHAATGPAGSMSPPWAERSAPRLTSITQVADLAPPSAGLAARPPASPVGATGGVLASTAPSASPLSDAFLQLWHQDMRTLHDEQRQSRALLASLSARLERAEREASQWAVIAGSAVLGLLALTVGARLWRDGRRPRVHGAWSPPQRPGRRSARDLPAAVAASDARVEPRLDPVPPNGADSAGRGSDPMAVAAAGAVASSQQAVDSNAAANASDTLFGPGSVGGFSQAALEEARHAELLDQVDRMAAEGYLGASVAVLENALQGRVGKSPGILLRLLDHYEALQQPWNRDRVGAELTAIYNVELPPATPGADAALPADEGPSLDAIGPAWDAIEASWSTPRATTTLADALVRPSPHPPLSLAAFRDALWLHTLSAERESLVLDRLQLGPSEPVPRAGAESAHAIADLDTDGQTDASGPTTTALPELTWTLEPVSP